MLRFSGWRPFFAFRDRTVDRAYLERIGAAGEAAFKAGIGSPKSGRVYRRRGGAHRASAPGEYPARDSGGHLGTVDHTVTAGEVQIGSGKFYAKFLRDGTSRMAPRSMSKEALTTAMENDNVGIGRFVRWRHR